VRLDDQTRGDFPILDRIVNGHRLVYLDSAASSQKPRSVIEAMARYYERSHANVHRSIHTLGEEATELYEAARDRVQRFIGAGSREEVVLTRGTTDGLNLLAEALGRRLEPGDEVLSTDLEYGACDLTWDRICRDAGARYVRAPISLPLVNVADELFACRTERTRAVYVSHITSETGLLLPVEEIVARARAEGLITIVDGAHAPGQVPLDLESLGADFYSGNCHKWLCAPKGSGFLHVRDEWQDRVDGPIVSWGHTEPSTFVSRTERQGTRDPAAYLAVPDAIAFVRAHDDVDRSVALARAARARLCELLGTEPLAPAGNVRRLASVRLPHAMPDLSRRLFDEHRIEIPTMGPRRDDLLRLSVAMYTTAEDVERLLDALPSVLSPSRSR